MTVERFRSAFAGARQRDDLRAWFVPGTTAERRLDRWLGREMAGVLSQADDRGRDAFAFQPIESRFFEVADDLRIRTPYSRAVVQEMRALPWAWWDGDLKAWRVPFRSWEELLKRWPKIEAAAQQNAPGERKKRQQARIGTPEQREAAARAAERRRRRYPLPDDPLPRPDRVVMTTAGAVIFTEVTGIGGQRHCGALLPGDLTGGPFAGVGNLAKTYPQELIKAWPARRQPDLRHRPRGRWQPSIDELRAGRRAAASRERALQKARAAATASQPEPIGPSSPLGGHSPGARGAEN